MKWTQLKRIRRTRLSWRRRAWAKIFQWRERMSDEEMDTASEASVESVTVTEVLELLNPTGEDRLCYRCRTSDGEDVYDRSDLMDGGPNQKKVLRFERLHPPKWDAVCPMCGSEGCEECECPDCERICRFINGVNYGCEFHPVV